jgi:putative FmdB family regulatory protein
MPLYEYRCPNGHDFEKFFRSIGTSSSEVACPVCGAVAQRVMSAAGLVFKGSGFYITDYGKDGKKAEREAAATAEKGKSAAAAPAASESAPSTPASKASEATTTGKSKSEPTPKSEASTKAAQAKPSASSKTSE